jgi:predicted 2-oxoglutarate/Fe(II)-dependent dioxygenase YbiX
MNYSINKFFTPEECKSIIDFAMEKGETFSYYDYEKTTWDCRRIYDEEFKKKILNTINDLHKQGSISFWFDFNSFNLTNINVSLTRYYEGRCLNLHLDKTSNYTTVISLTEGYEDGDFCLSPKFTNLEDSEVIQHLNIGEGITFEGNKTYHGVMPVNSGLRCALNIWMNDTNFVYYKIDKEKKLL